MDGKTREGGVRSSEKEEANESRRTATVIETGSPVFLYAGFRTASTWLWSRFRANTNSLAYYEFFHEQLAAIKTSDIPSTNSKAWNSHHPDTPPYWIEYLPLITADGGLVGFSSEMAFKGYVPPGGLEGGLRRKERDYVARLIKRAAPRGKTPVLADNRILGRISALKGAFRGTHIVLHRNLFQQWNSFSSLLRQGNGYFIDTVKWTIENGHEDEFFHFLDSQLTHDRNSATPWFEAMSSDDVFSIFVALHVYLFVHARRHADIFIGVNELASDPAVCISVERSVEEKTGLKVDLSDARNAIDAPAQMIMDRDATAIRIETFVGRGLEVLNASLEERDFAQSMLSDMWAEHARFQFYAGPTVAAHAKELKSHKSAELERAIRDLQSIRQEIEVIDRGRVELQQGADAERSARLRKEGELVAVERQLEIARSVEVALREDLAANAKKVARLEVDLETGRSSATEASERERELRDKLTRHEAADEKLLALPAELQNKLSIFGKLTDALRHDRRRARDLSAVLAGFAKYRPHMPSLPRIPEEGASREISASERTAAMAVLEAIGAAVKAEHLLAQERWQGFVKQARRARFPVKRRNRPSRYIDRALRRLGPVGDAMIIGRSGLWSRRLQATPSAPNARERGIVRYAASRSNASANPIALFDQAFYLASNPDIAGRGMSPLVHYVMFGDAEGRSPHPLFSAKYYRLNNGHGVGSTGLTTLQHFLAHGAAEGRNPHPLFDLRHYVGQVGDLEGLNPLVHYLRVGWRKGLNPHPLFANDWYLQQNPDVADLGVPPLIHYVTTGADEGRRPHPLFFGDWYGGQISDVADIGSDPLTHYLVAGANERRDPNPYFSNHYYLSQLSGPLPEGIDPLTHYLQVGAWRGLSPREDLEAPVLHLLLSKEPCSRVTPLEMWLDQSSDHVSRKPTRAPAAHENLQSLRPQLEPLFDAKYYREQAGDLLNPSADALKHYLSVGWRIGLNPHQLFSNNFYLERYPDLIAGEENPLVHFVLFGASELRDPHPLFNSKWYCRTYPDVEAGGENPLVHFIRYGGREGRHPSPTFNSTEYLQANPDVGAAGANPLIHFLVSWPLEPRDSWAPPDDLAALGGVDPVSWLQKQALLLTTTLATSVDEIRRISHGESASTPSTLFGDLIAASRPKAVEDMFDLPAYRKLSEQLRIQRSDIRGARPITAPKTLNIFKGEVEGAVAGLRFERPETPKVSIIIPVFNNFKFTLECLMSLAQSGGLAETEVIVIDDGSSDETAQQTQAIEGVRYIRNPENLGFLLTCNRAAQQAKGDVLVFLNNDTQVTTGWLAHLADMLWDDDQVGAVAPKLIFPNGRLQEAGALIDAEGRAELIGVFDDPNAPRYNYPRPVDYASGACLAVRRADFEALSGFDTHFAPAYCEDADLCFRLRAMGKKIMYAPDSVVVHHLSVSSNSVAPEYKSRLAVRNQQRFVERWGQQLEQDNKVRVVSFYLPQFHTIPENDRWWGTGFTEWTNVTRALPNYRGHYQPHRPAELGYYDLADPRAMERQADLAKQYGVHGFLYYYYWFSGRRVLEKPLERLLRTGKPDLPFALCWANENWTRTWDGQERDVLLAQKHLPDDGENFIKDIAPWLRMENYIRINGKPLLVVYRPGLIPEVEKVADQWRAYARANGIGELYLAFVEQFEHARTFPDPEKYGFDATIEFPPAGTAAPIQPPGVLLNPDFTGIVNDYHEVVRTYMREPVPGHTRFRSVMPSWDNTARRQDKSYMYHHASPGAFQAWLEAVFEETRRQNHGDERMVFVNAWNEWAEGAHLEPDTRFGHGWLEAVRNAHDAQRLVRR